jgi:hypothetical protein
VGEEERALHIIERLADAVKGGDNKGEEDADEVTCPQITSPRDAEIGSPPHISLNSTCKH